MKKNHGFTLMELLIVIGIIGILAAMALPRFQAATNRAKSRVDDANIRMINTQIELYQIETSWWPEYPNMDSLLTSVTYFPSGPPKCPFLNSNALGTYTLFMGDNIMRVESVKHSSSGDASHQGTYVD